MSQQHLFTCHLGHFPQSISDWVQREYLCLDVSLWYQVIRISVYMLRPPLVLRQLVRLSEKIQKFTTKGSCDLPTLLATLHNAQGGWRIQNQEKKKKGARKVSNFFYLFNKYLFLRNMFFFRQVMFGSWPVWSFCFWIFESYIQSFTSQAICSFIATFYRLFLILSINVT